MKKLLLIISIFFSLSSFAQTEDSTYISDSTISSYANDTLPLVLPVEAVGLYAYYYSVNNAVWANRLAPNTYKSYIGSGTQPDSLVHITLTAQQITQFTENLLGERFGAVYTYAETIFFDSPSLTGYQSLIGQLIVFSVNGTQEEKNAYAYINKYYGAYSANLTSLINGYYSQGIYWIQH